jgi:uncharacterized HAD superfamily protein
MKNGESGQRKKDSIIGTDLDDVLIKTADVILYLLERYYRKSFDFNQITQYSIANSLNIDRKIEEQHVKMAIESDIMEPEQNAVQVFNWLSDLHPMYIISRREHYLYNHTVQTLNRLGFRSYRLILFHENDDSSVPHYKDKYEIINKYGIELYIEDNPSMIENIYKHTDAECLIYDKPWNQGLLDNERRRRVYSWIEIRNYILWRSTCRLV